MSRLRKQTLDAARQADFSQPKKQALPPSTRKLQEEHCKIVGELEQIHETAESEERALTAKEQARWDELTGDLSLVNDDIREAQRLAHEAAFDLGERGDALFNADGVAVRGLRQDESLEAHYRSQEPTNRFESRYRDDDEQLSLGTIVRAMVNGPRNEAEMRALAEGTDSAGGYSVPTILSAQAIDALRARTVAIQAGSEVVPLKSDKHDYAKLLTDPVAAWRAENAAVAESEPTFGRVRFTPQTLGVVFKASRELLEDSVNIDTMIENSLARSFAVKLDEAVLVGTGLASQPKGLMSMAGGINEHSMGTNGAAIKDFTPFHSAIRLIEEDNAMVPDGFAAVMAPRTSETLANLTDADSNPLTRPPRLQSMRTLVTTSVPIDQVQGTESAASTIFLGDWSEVKIGIRTRLKIELLRERFADNLQFGFLAYLRADVQCFHEQGMCRIVGIAP